jgi:NADH:ubiquinone oxidoreductase subunit 6 (subunit J)
MLSLIMKEHKEHTNKLWKLIIIVLVILLCVASIVNIYQLQVNRKLSAQTNFMNNVILMQDLLIINYYPPIWLGLILILFY